RERGAFRKLRIVADHRVEQAGVDGVEHLVAREQRPEQRGWLELGVGLQVQLVEPGRIGREQRAPGRLTKELEAAQVRQRQRVAQSRVQRVPVGQDVEQR